MDEWLTKRKKIREKLEEGVKRNKVLPLDWAMDRIDDVLEEFSKRLKKDINNVVNFEDYQKMWLIQIIDKLAGNKLVKENLADGNL